MIHQPNQSQQQQQSFDSQSHQNGDEQRNKYHRNYWHCGTCYNPADITFRTPVPELGTPKQLVTGYVYRVHVRPITNTSLVISTLHCTTIVTTNDYVSINYHYTQQPQSTHHGPVPFTPKSNYSNLRIEQPSNPQSEPRTANWRFPVCRRFVTRDNKTILISIRQRTALELQNHANFLVSNFLAKHQNLTEEICTNWLSSIRQPMLAYVLEALTSREIVTNEFMESVKDLLEYELPRLTIEQQEQFLDAFYNLKLSPIYLRDYDFCEVLDFYDAAGFYICASQRPSPSV